MFDSIKGMFLTFAFVTFVLVGLSMLPQVQGMPIATQLSQIANNTLMYIQQFLSPLINLFYRWLG